MGSVLLGGGEGGHASKFSMPQFQANHDQTHLRGTTQQPGTLMQAQSRDSPREPARSSLGKKRGDTAWGARAGEGRAEEEHSRNPPTHASRKLY